MSNSGSLIRMFIFWANIFSFLAYVMINKSDSEAAILISTFLTFVLDYFFSRNIILSYFAFQKFYPDHSNRLKIIYEKKR